MKLSKDLIIDDYKVTLVSANYYSFHNKSINFLRSKAILKYILKDILAVKRTKIQLILNKVKSTI